MCSELVTSAGGKLGIFRIACVVPCPSYQKGASGEIAGVFRRNKHAMACI